MNDMEKVPILIYEKEISFRNKIIKFLIGTIIMLIITLGITIYLFSSFVGSYDRISYDQNGNGINNYNTGEQGDLINESEITN